MSAQVVCPFPADVEVVVTNALQEAHRIAGQWLLEHTEDPERGATLHALFGERPGRTSRAAKEASRKKAPRPRALTAPRTP